MQPVRGHNEGTIYPRRADRRFVAQVTMPDGSRPTASCPHRHELGELRRRRFCPEARDLLAELLRIRDARLPPDIRRLTLGRFLPMWLDSVRPTLAPATWRKHESIVRTGLLPALGRRLLTALSVADVRAYLAGLAVGPQSRRHHRATLRRALADAVREGYVARNVAALAEAPALPHRERTALTAAQVRVLLEGTREDRLHAFWTLAATTGMREAEMLGLTWADVNLETAQVTVRRTLQRVDGEWQRRPTKSRQIRTVPLTAMAVAALRDHRARQLAERMEQGRPGADGLVFTTSRGHPVHGSNLSKVLYAHLARLGLPRVTVHDLRHSAATVLLAQGVPLHEVAAILGHSTIRVTNDIYGHLAADDLRDAAARMQEAVG